MDLNPIHHPDNRPLPMAPVARPVVGKRSLAEAAASWKQYHESGRPGESWDAFERRELWEKERAQIPTMPVVEPPAPAIAYGFAAGLVYFLVPIVTKEDRLFLGFWGGILITLFAWAVNAVWSARARGRRWKWSQTYWPLLSGAEQQTCNYRRWAEETWDRLSDLEREEVKRKLFPPQVVYEGPNMTTALIMADNIHHHRHH